jgi:hypothetical protein
LGFVKDGDVAKAIARVGYSRRVRLRRTRALR